MDVDLPVRVMGRFGVRFPEIRVEFLVRKIPDGIQKQIDAGAVECLITRLEKHFVQAMYHVQQEFKRSHVEITGSHARGFNAAKSATVIIKQDHKRVAR